MDLVLPQYYEWHTEMQKICSSLGLGTDPNKITELYKEVNRYLQRRCDEKGCHVYAFECPRAYARFVFLKRNVSAKMVLAMVAYVRALERSHDFNTQRFGEKALNLFFLGIIFHRNANEVSI